MDAFWSTTYDSTSFNLYSKSHMTSLVIIGAIILGMFLMREHIQKNRRKVGLGIGIMLIIQQFLMYSWYITSGNFTWQESLPLYLCRVTTILCIIMILRESYAFFEVAYFWGMSGSVMALITPDPGFEFPHVMFVQFFMGHGGMLISILFMMCFYKFEPKLSSLKKTINWTIVYFVGVEMVNYAIGANYSYLRSKPLSKSPLDYLPPYPYYVPILAIIAVGIFSLWYIPFYIRDKKSEIIKEKEEVTSY